MELRKKILTVKFYKCSGIPITLPTNLCLVFISLHSFLDAYVIPKYYKKSIFIFSSGGKLVSLCLYTYNLISHVSLTSQVQSVRDTEFIYHFWYFQLLHRITKERLLNQCQKHSRGKTVLLPKIGETAARQC